MIAATVDGVRIVCVYVPNGQTVDSDKYRYKLDWCRAATALLARRARAASARSRCRRLQHRARGPRRARSRGCGAGRCCLASRSARCSATGSALGLKTASACSSSRRRRSAGGTTGSSRFRRTTVCASTTSCSSPALAGDVHGLPHRPQRAQGRAAVGPRAGDRRVRGLSAPRSADSTPRRQCSPARRLPQLRSSPSSWILRVSVLRPQPEPAAPPRCGGRRCARARAGSACARTRARSRSPMPCSPRASACASSRSSAATPVDLAGRAAAPAAGSRNFGRQVGDVDRWPGRHHREPVAEVLELAHVARET